MSQCLLDLRKCIQNIQYKGDLVFAGIGLNDPIERHDFQAYFVELNMHEAILAAHPKTSPPVINILNLANYSIDELWCSISILSVRAGYLKFGMEVLSNHRTV